MKPTETGTLRSVLLKHPREAFESRERIEREWRALNWLAPPEFDLAMRQYDRFVEALADRGKLHISFLPPDPRTGMDSIYVRDAVVSSATGLILCRMGKELRSGEPQALQRALAGPPAGPDAGLLAGSITGSITGSGRLEGGDVVWLDGKTVAVGEGYRTNAEGIRQLQKILGEAVDEVIPVPLPHWTGPDDVLHLMSFLSPLTPALALVYSRLMPVPFRRLLLERETRFVEVPDEEYDSMGCNVLALSPARCLALDGNPITRRRMEAAGVEVVSYEGSEISRKGGGGPTCLTRPLTRD